MKQQLKETTIYAPNKNVRVTVVNKPVLIESTGEIVQEATVTIKTAAIVGHEKLQFRDSEQLADFIANIDVDDPQTELAL